MAKNGFGFGAFNWLVVLAAVLALVYYLYEGGKFSEGGGGAVYGVQRRHGASRVAVARHVHPGGIADSRDQLLH